MLTPRFISALLCLSVMCSLACPLPLKAAPNAPAATMGANAASVSPFAVPDEQAFFALLDLNRPGLAQVKKAVSARDWTAAKAAWARHLETRMSPRWVWTRRERAKIISFLKANDHGLSRYITPADAVLNRQFIPQGVPYQLEKNVNWQLKLSEETHVLSRFLYWRDMGLAYWQTGQSKYPADFVYLLKDWLADNSVPHDLSAVHKSNTQWRSLEAGIRVVSWWDAMEFFMDAPEFDAEAKYQMSKSLVEHARYLYAWTPAFQGGNWQVSEAGGVAIMGIMLPEAKESAQWREQGLLRYTEHMQKDVLPDGGHSELTPGYHSWVMNQFTRVAQLCRLNGYDMPGLLARHELMFDWLLKLSKPDRVTPAPGDTRGVNIQADMAQGALLYHRADMRALGTQEVPPALIWLFGTEMMDKYAALPARVPDYTSCLLPNSQYLMMRTGWSKNDSYLLFDCAPGGAGHHHQDKLQVTMYAGRDLIIDPGIYSYNQPLSGTYFRKPEAHNVLLIDGKASPASNEAKYNPRVLAWKSDAQFDLGSGVTEFDGFRHQRDVLFVKPNYWVVVDHVTGAGEHEVKRLFHFLPGQIQADGSSVRTLFATGMNVRVQAADDARVQIGKGWYPTGSATAVESPIAAYVSTGKLPMTLITVLSPFSDAKDLPNIERVTGGDANVARLRLIFPNGQRDEIAMAAEPMRLQVGTYQAQGRALIVRHGPQESQGSL